MPKEICQDRPTEEELENLSKKNIAMLKTGLGMPMANLPVAPFSQWLNGKLLSVDRGEVSARYQLRPEMANPTGILHGGLQCALIDELIGIACFTLGFPGFHLSIDITVNYLGRVKVDEEITCYSKIIREGNKIVNAQAEIRGPDNRVIASGHSNLLVTTKEVDFVKNFEQN
ncbi:hypothetical protein NEF87_000349 [Candidatus Lokiarchaeum ossiferum]|uniref:Thioesterase domain-containing protein n=1 Tax=Candidatus Lokiarchaeum ossiferum TaxID=2951803 RepID=A0ABY6HKL1_9ARCH|nr:hypothetical protein NEF87_000349 [Candidatus Lokiarchaeum sp. B-35]